MLHNDIHFSHEFYKGKTFEQFKKNESHYGMDEAEMKEVFAQLQKFDPKKEDKKKADK